MAEITIGELAADGRLTDGSDPVEPELGILTRLKAAAVALTDARVKDTIPDATRNQIIAQLVKYWYNQPDAPEGGRHMAAWHYSGAGVLAAPFRKLRTGFPEAA